MTKRILQIIPSLDRAGAEKQMGLLARGLPGDEFEVHVCALTRGGPLAGELTSAGVEVEVIGKRWRFDPQAYWRLKQHVARLRPDLIHTWMMAANVYGYAAARACGVGRVVTSQRCVDPWKGGVDLAIERYVARDDPVDCAGSYKLESLGIWLVDRLDGEDESSIVGLPLLRLTRMLRGFGVRGV